MAVVFVEQQIDQHVVAVVDDVVVVGVAVGFFVADVVGKPSNQSSWNVETGCVVAGKNVEVVVVAVVQQQSSTHVAVSTDTCSENNMEKMLD